MSDRIEEPIVEERILSDDQLSSMGFGDMLSSITNPGIWLKIKELEQRIKTLEKQSNLGK